MAKDRINKQSAEIVEVVTLDELCLLCSVQTDWIVELVSEGILEPEGDKQPDWRFSANCISRTQIAWRLKQDLGVNQAGIAIALDLLEERKKMQQRLLQPDEG